jgi:hypothetical protein
MRRLGLSWMVSLLLLLAQHGALLHELSHFSRDTHTAGATLRQDSRPLESGPCLTCEAFSQVTNPATAGAAHVPLCPPALIPAPDPCYAVVAADAPTPRSRGPPQV